MRGQLGTLYANHFCFVVVPQICHEIWTKVQAIEATCRSVPMVERIISELSDKAYETILGICAACCFVSLFLAATV